MILTRTVELLKLAHGSPSKSTFDMENLADPKVHPKPSMIATAEVDSLRYACGAVDAVFDQCMFGLDHKSLR